jgi:hypothetical protein
VQPNPAKCHYFSDGPFTCAGAIDGRTGAVCDRRSQSVLSVTHMTKTKSPHDVRHKFLPCLPRCIVKANVKTNVKTNVKANAQANVQAQRALTHS